jgi:hypothetical protein
LEEIDKAVVEDEVDNSNIIDGVEDKHIPNGWHFLEEVRDTAH